MPYPAIEKFLMDTIGLDPESIGSKAVERAVSGRMKLASIVEETQYLTLLKTTETELEALIESVVVPETWFFRDHGPFGFLREYASHEWRASEKGRTLRILSVPCATGEEPYSIAITLIEAGFAENEFSIDAVDISIRALKAARQGIFAKGSFREKDMDHLRRYFTRIEQGYRVQDQMLNLVHFQRGNILDPNFSVGRPCYDVIFCRNLLIYMTPTAKKQILDNLDRVLAEGGLFFTGHTETMLIRSYGYSALKRARVFAFRKEKKDVAEVTKKPAKTMSREETLVFPKRLVQAAPQRPKKTPLPEDLAIELKKPLVPDEPERLLHMVRELGNKGALEEAKALCDVFLQQHRLNSEAYYLMGMLQEASKRYDLAEECFNRALYLNPNHYPVLVQLYLLYEQRGDNAKAMAFRERASRVQTLQKDSDSGPLLLTRMTDGSNLPVEPTEGTKSTG